MLVCKECGYENEKDIIPHIDANHDLSAYMEDHKPTTQELILDGFTSEKKTEAAETVAVAPPVTKAKKVTPPKDGSVVSFGKSPDSVDLKINTENTEEGLVPSENKAYLFPKFTSDVAQDVIESKNVMLTGHTGCGKTSLIQQIASKINQPTIRVNLNGQITVGDFNGLWTIKGGETVWVDGALPMAMRKGHWLILDEIDFGEAQILSMLNSVLEKGGTLTLKEKDHEVITPHPNFRIFATANTAGCMQDFRGLYQGTNPLNEAFLDRWKVYHVDYLLADEEAKVLNDTVPRMTPTITKGIVKVVNMVRSAHINEEVACTFSLRRAIDWAEAMVRHKNPIKAAESTVFSKVSREDAAVIKGIIERVMTGKEG